jgi:hypothetical protein
MIRLSHEPINTGIGDLARIFSNLHLSIARTGITKARVDGTRIIGSEDQNVKTDVGTRAWTTAIAVEYV